MREREKDNTHTHRRNERDESGNRFLRHNASFDPAAKIKFRLLTTFKLRFERSQFIVIHHILLRPLHLHGGPLCILRVLRTLPLCCCLGALASLLGCARVLLHCKTKQCHLRERERKRETERERERERKRERERVQSIVWYSMRKLQTSNISFSKGEKTHCATSQLSRCPGVHRVVKPQAGCRTSGESQAYIIISRRIHTMLRGPAQQKTVLLLAPIRNRSAPHLHHQHHNNNNNNN